MDDLDPEHESTVKCVLRDNATNGIMMTHAARFCFSPKARTFFLLAEASSFPALSARRRAPSEMSPNVGYAPLASKEEESPSKAGLATENPPLRRPEPSDRPPPRNPPG